MACTVPDAGPLGAARELRRADPASYRGTAAQEARILERLKRGPASRRELDEACGCGSATKRISALRARGVPIASRWTTCELPEWDTGVQALYWLTQPDTTQRDLFTDTRP